GVPLPLGMVVIKGKLISAPLPRRSVFAISSDGKAVIQSFDFHGRIVTSDNDALSISAVNRPPQAAGVAVYTAAYGPLTPPFQLAAVVRNGVVESLTSGRILIPEDGYVLAVNEADAGLLLQLHAGERVWMKLDLTPDLEVISALGGGPRLVKEGREFIPFDWEWFSHRLHQKRAPRTAVGITEAGKLLLVTVDGRSRQNTGMTLRELAQVMISLSAREAMNLDGGGSATMVVGGRIMNEPSDGRERPVASALIILYRSR
ncbi:MAG: phosphodiester glycosidase family protein, partial [Armatimonadetes bacterium]|nr:phosphodiester glycosidase family protein [Armatimonadota bacterium]